jgi:predicted phage baseplate assembly protein
MPLVSPNLDSRTFEQLVTEVRRRIPTLTPEWTDLNESDPGITLAQLFAFMSEQLLFQINQVPDKGLITFLKLVGLDLHPPSPATADVTLIPEGATEPSSPVFFAVDRRTRIETSGPPPGEKAAIVFETIHDESILNGELVDLVSQDCTLAFRSHANANESLAGAFAPLGTASTAQDGFFLVFQLNAPAKPWEEGRFRVRVNVAGSRDVGEPPVEEFDSEAPPRLEWSFASGVQTNFDGSETLVFTVFEPALDSTNELTRSGYLEFDFDATQAAAFIRAPAADPFEPEFFRDRFVIRARMVRANAYAEDGAPSLNTVRLNTVPARAVQSVEDESLGASLGLPFQRFRLANAPAVVGSVVLTIDEGSESGGVEEWVEITDLFSAGPDDRVFQLLPATGEILFGNGVFGKLPPPDNGTAEGNIRARYQIGGGARGNVGAETLTNVFPRGTDLPAFSATNVLPAAGGAEEEGVTEGVARAPAVIRSRFRAVTARDFEALARETPEVRVDRAFALPNTRPGLVPGSSPGSVTVLLVPHARFEQSINAPIEVQPHISAAVLRYLDERRLVTTEVFTDAPVYRKVTADISLQLEPFASLSDTRRATLMALNRFFHALVGWTDESGWPFGGTVFFSRVFEHLVNVPGVARVDQALLKLDDGPFVDCEDLLINRGELLFSGPHVVRVQGRVGG